jgi:hypothetical protein
MGASLRKANASTVPQSRLAVIDEHHIHGGRLQRRDERGERKSSFYS